MRMNHSNINFIRQKQSCRRSINASLFLHYIHDLHLSIFDLVAYHALIVANLFAGISIVIQVLAGISVRYLIGALRVASRFCLLVWVLIKTSYAVLFRLPFLFFLFCLRVFREYVSDFFYSVFFAAQKQITASATAIDHSIQRRYTEFLPRVSFLVKNFFNVFSPHSYSLPRQWYMRVAAFSFMALLIVSPFVVFGSLDTLREVKHETTIHIENGLSQFLNATNALTSQDAARASVEFEKSLGSFQDAKHTLYTLGSHTRFFARLIPFTGKKIQDVEALIRAGEEFSLAGSHAASLLTVFAEPDSVSPEKISASLAYLQEAVDTTSMRLENGYKNLISIDVSSIPQEYQNKFEDIKKSIAIFIDTAHTIRPLVSALPLVLGVPQDRRYLIVLQNNSEIRATGGFMGSFALVDVKKGAVKKIELPGGGTYDVKGQLRELRISPWPLHLINARWEFQDSNWFADFPTSARKIKWFYENTGGPTVDGVIAINASLAERLLAITGPIDLPSFKKTITSENFFETTERAVELEYDRRENKPKKFLGELVERVIQRVSEQKGEQQHKIAAMCIDALLSKEIQLYSADPDIQQVITSSGLSGGIRNTQGDYLMIVDTNVGGRKTDRVMRAEATYRVHQNLDGTLDATLSMTRTHNGQKGNYFTGGKNVDYIRIYVPRGSTILSAQGFSPPPQEEFENPPEGAVPDSDLTRIQGPFTVDEKTGMILNHEFGKTVFSNWIQTDVGETSSVQITYRLPFRFSFGVPYTLYLQRQSASVLRAFDFSFNEFTKKFEPFVRDEFINAL
ncbi:DUF4012 domain-containing protein [Candidatus Uhrbacteria bacterium]|nr:DUF4012 domain-containing protein [Candidatus Uhrbacteria bacterium]